MILSIDKDKKSLVASVYLGTSGNFNFQVKFPLDELKRLLDNEIKDLSGEWSASETEVSCIIDDYEYGEDL